MSKLSWQTIPGELLDKILACLDDPIDTLQAVLVCKNWRRIVYPQIYTSIALKTTLQASCLVETLKESIYEPGVLVKYLNLGDLWITGDKKELLTLITQCPKLACLNTGDRKITDALYSDLLALFNQGHLQHIQSIPSFWPGKKEALKDVYCCAALAMKGSLTHLQVVEPTAAISGSKKCCQINLLEHLTSFPCLQTIDVDYVAATFLYDQDALIDLCATQTSKVHYKLSNSSLFRQSQPPKVSQLELGKIKQQPHVKELLIYGDVITTRDLEYIMHKFTGLGKVAVGGGYRHQYNAISWLRSIGMLSNEVSTRFFQFLVSIGSFKAAEIATSLEVEEMLEFVAKRRQVKTMALSHCHDVSAEALHLSLLNKKRELRHSSTEFSNRNDGTWEMMVNALNDDYMTLYKQVLRQFAGDSVEEIHLEQVLKEPLAEDDDITEALSYILDHYTAVKDIALSGVLFEFYNANTIRRLDSLTFLHGTVHPRALSQLSSSLEYINKLMLEDDPMKVVVGDDAYMSIDMPHTAFGEIALPDLHYYNDEETVVIQIHTSATDTTHYLMSYKAMNEFVSKDVLEYESNGIDPDDIVFVRIKCVDLEKFNTGRVCFHIRSQDIYIL